MKDINNPKDLKTINKLAYLGSGFLLVSPFTMDYTYTPLFAILGLLLITPQVWSKNQWNLVILNFTGVLGYGWTLYWRLVELPFYPF